MALCTGWFTIELYYSTNLAMDTILGACTACVVAVAILWQAAALTTQMQDQSVKLFELHKIAVEILTRGLQCEDPTEVKGVKDAQTEFYLEYSLIKEFMTVNQGGFKLLEFRVERSHALTMTTVLVPSLLKHVYTHPDFGQVCSLGCASVHVSMLIFVSAMVTLASSVHPAASGHENLVHTISRWGSHMKCIFCKCWEHTALVVVLVAFVLRALQMA